VTEAATAADSLASTQGYAVAFSDGTVALDALVPQHVQGASRAEPGTATDSVTSGGSVSDTLTESATAQAFQVGDVPAPPSGDGDQYVIRRRRRRG
jgi:hypothetical protein